MDVSRNEKRYGRTILTTRVDAGLKTDWLTAVGLGLLLSLAVIPLLLVGVQL